MQADASSDSIPSNDTSRAATSCTLTVTPAAAGEEEEGGAMLTSVGGSLVQALM